MKIHQTKTPSAAASAPPTATGIADAVKLNGRVISSHAATRRRSSQPRLGRDPLAPDEVGKGYPFAATWPAAAIGRGSAGGTLEAAGVVGVTARCSSAP